MRSRRETRQTRVAIVCSMATVVAFAGSLSGCSAADRELKPLEIAFPTEQEDAGYEHAPKIDANEDGVLNLDVVRLPGEGRAVATAPVSEDGVGPLSRGGFDDDGMVAEMTTDVPFLEITPAERAAASVISRLDDGTHPVLASLAQLYGEQDFGIDDQELARWVTFLGWEDKVSSEFERPTPDEIAIGPGVDVLDANDKVVARAHHFKAIRTGVGGLIVVSTHTRATLIQHWDVGPESTLDADVVYQITDGRLIYDRDGAYQTDHGVTITHEELADLRKASLEDLWKTSRDLLARRNLETKTQINEILAARAMATKFSQTQ